jgi:hypothetical protein
MCHGLCADGMGRVAFRMAFKVHADVRADA